MQGKIRFSEGCYLPTSVEQLIIILVALVACLRELSHEILNILTGGMGVVNPPSTAPKTLLGA